ncbi:MAG: heme-binding protein [Pseudomonadota bacterium]
MRTLSRFSLAICATLATASAMAQAPAAAPAPGALPPAPPRARGPEMALAVEAAQTAIAVCLANGYKTTATVVDSAGVPVVMLSSDGAAERTQMIGLTKTAATIKYKVPSGDIADRAKTDAALDAEMMADPKIGTARRGALPIKVGGEIIGAMSVSGAPGGDKDQVCAQAGLDKIASRLK